MTNPEVGIEAVDRIRNLAIVAHINAGKTTLSERILVVTGRQRFFGEVDAGMATMDWRPEEQERGISINSAVTQVEWEGHRIQIVDTPGHVDFAAEVASCLHVVDAAVVVIDGVRGVEPQTEAVWRRLDEERLPRIVFVNKLDRPVADLGRAIRSVEERFRVRCALIDHPTRDGGGELAGCIELLGAEPLGDPLLDDARDALLATLGESDPELFTAFVEARHPGRARMIAALRQATLARALIPVLCGSALRDVGVRRLLDAVCALLPSPRDRSGRLGQALGPACGDPDAPVALQVYSSADPFGERAMGASDVVPVLARVFSGTVRPGDRLESANGQVTEVLVVGSVHAAEREVRAQALPGEMVALALDPPVASGCTLRAPGSSLEFEAVQLSEPVLRAVLEPELSEQRAELEVRARAVAAVDRVVRVGTDPQTGDLIVEVMGELHLDVFRSRLRRAYGAGFRLGEPRVLLRVVPRRAADAMADVGRPVDGLAHTASAEVHLEPAPDRGLVMRWAVPTTGSRSEEVESDLRREVLGELESVARRGWTSSGALTDCALEIRKLQSSGEAAALLALEAVQLACARAVQAADPVVQEPRVRLHVRLPQDALGPVIAELNARHASVEDVSSAAGSATIACSLALARTLGWTTTLRSRTRGIGTFELFPDGWIDVEPA